MGGPAGACELGGGHLATSLHTRPSTTQLQQDRCAARAHLLYRTRSRGLSKGPCWPPEKERE